MPCIICNHNSGSFGAGGSSRTFGDPSFYPAKLAIFALRINALITVDFIAS
jgi:hypothetical protein